MTYQGSSALTKHMLDSIIPHEISPYQPKQFTKTREFYKPEQFIWNNPHRASDKIYKFHHKYHDNYLKHKEPVIKDLEEHDRKQREFERIKKLTEVKEVTRERFYSRQRDRDGLEILSGTRRASRHSQSDYISTASKRFTTISHYHPKPTKFEPMVPSYKCSKMPIKGSEKLLTIQQTYMTGVEQSEAKQKDIENMIVDETRKYQNKVKNDFERQKSENSKKISRISKLDKQPIVGQSLF